MSHSGRQGMDVKARVPGWAKYEWVALTGVVVLGMGLAVWGGAGSAWARTSDGLELLYPHFPPAASAGTSSQMMVARVLLPLVALYATVRFVVSFYAQRLRLFRLRRLDGHSVVCGLSESGRRAALTMCRDGAQVVVVDEDSLSRSAASVIAAGARILVADPTSAAVLEAAAMRRANARGMHAPK